jgi:hypothetical protein
MVRVKMQIGVNRNYVACLLPPLVLPLPLLLILLPLASCALFSLRIEPSSSVVYSCPST